MIYIIIDKDNIVKSIAHGAEDYSPYVHEGQTVIKAINDCELPEMELLFGSIFVDGSLVKGKKDIYKSLNFNLKPDVDVYWEYDGKKWVDSRQISIIQAMAKTEIDKLAENVRSRYITAGSAQAMTYVEKANEAQSYKNAGYPKINRSSQYPHLRAEAKVLNITIRKAADMILASRNDWLNISASIEKERRQGSVNVAKSTTLESIKKEKQDAINALLALISET